MAQADPWAEFRSGGPAAAPAPAGPAPITLRAPTGPSPADERAAAAAERERIRFEQEQEDRRLYGPPGRRSARQLPQTAIDRLGDGTASLMALDRALSNFRDDYAGNTILGDFENRAQAVLGTGTPGQRDWWADVRSTDNVARNALFGAALTATEKAAWEATTVNPRMTAAEVRRNLERRRALARGALRRLSRTYRANGFNEDAIRESLGELQSIVDETPDHPEAANPAGASDPQRDDDAVPPGREGSGTAMRSDQLPPTPSGAAQFQFQFQRGINSGRFRTVRDAMAFVRQYNEQNGTNFNANAADLRQAIEYVRSGRRGVTVQVPAYDVDISGARGEPTEGTPEQRQSARDLESLDAIGRGAADTVSLGLADEFAAAGDTLFNGGTYEYNLARQRAIDRSDEQHHPVARLAGQAFGGFALPTGGASSARQLAAIGAGYGGAYGFGSGEGGIGDRLVNAGEYAAVGGGSATLLGLGANALASRFASRAGARDPRSELIAAAERQGIELIPADTGGGMVRRLTAGVNQSPVGGAQITAGAERTAEQFGNRVASIAATEGTPVRQEVLGETIEGALGSFNLRSGEEGAAMYRGAREMVGDRQFIGMNAVQRIDEHLDELGQNPATNAPLIAGLERLRADLAQPEAGLRLKSIDAIRQLRTSTRAEAQTEGLRGTDYQRRAREVLDDLSDDIAADLAPQEAAEFRRADAAWRERLDFIDDVEARLLGPRGDRSAEQVTRRLMEMTRGDSARFRRVLEQVTPEEAGIIRGSVISEMGRPPPGRPGNFSIETWARNFRALPERTQSVLFRGENRAHANDLLRIAEAVEGTNRYRNTSNTAGAAAVIEALKIAGSGVAAYTTYGATLAAEGLAGRLLASPRVARLLANPPRDRSRALRRLSQIATREPALAPDINVLQHALEGGARSAAAEENEDPR